MYVILLIYSIGQHYFIISKLLKKNTNKNFPIRKVKMYAYKRMNEKEIIKK